MAGGYLGTLSMGMRVRVSVGIFSSRAGRVTTSSMGAHHVLFCHYYHKMYIVEPIAGVEWTPGPT